MIYLILAILCSAGVSIFMRASEKYCQGHYGILLMNYVVCVLAGLILTGRGLTQTDGKGMPVTIVFGVVTGLLYCGSFILLQWNVRKNGVILSSTFMKLGVIVPAVLAVVWFGERPGWNQGLGFILAITAILMIHLEKGKIRTEKAYTIGLLLLLLGGGLGDSMAKFYDVYGNPGLLFNAVIPRVRNHQWDSGLSWRRENHKVRSAFWRSDRNSELLFRPVSFVGAGRHPGSYHISDVQYRCHGFDRRGGRPDVPGEADKETVGGVSPCDSCCRVVKYVENRKCRTESLRCCKKR